jgi:endogenous inhibitor of DNA gyrase (YacG/DUF329 family)
VDLHRWLSGAYAVPAAEDDDAEARPADGERQLPQAANGRRD